MNLKLSLLKVLLAVPLFFVWVVPISGQTIQPPKVSSPNAATLDKFGEIPVNLFSGTPDISIPIHTVSYGNIKVPIALRYHPASVRVVNHPSWVGLGWDLESIGVITRTQRQGIDEVYSDNHKTDFDAYYPIPNSPFPKSGADMVQTRSDWYSLAGMQTYFQTNNNGTQIQDVEPDEFSFNVLGHSGKFYYMGAALGWKVISDENIRVELNTLPGSFLLATDIHNIIGQYSTHYFENGTFNPGEQSRMFSGFTLTMPDGMKFIFGGSDAVELNSLYGAQTSPTYKVDSWLLKKIVDINGHEVTFNYKRSYPTCDYYIYYQGYDYSCSNNAGFLLYASANQGHYGQVPDLYTGEFHFPMYLSSITTPNETVSFTSTPATCLRDADINFYNKLGTDGVASTASGQYVRGAVNGDVSNIQWEKLDNIVIKDETQNIFRQYAFGYTHGTDDMRNQRLTLYGLTMQDKNAAPVGSYAFAYDNPNGKKVSDLPLYIGNYTDHYGFYNGKSIIGATADQMLTLRQTDASLVTTGLLSQISYPTGGYTQLGWEAHDYSQYLPKERNALISGTGYAGGSRISTIKSYLADGTLATAKTFYYKRGYTPSSNVGTLTSSGVLNGLPKYKFDLSLRPGLVSGASVTYGVHLESANTLHSYGANGQGQYLGYDEVVEVNRDGSYVKNFFSSYGPDYNGVSHYDIAPLGTVGWQSTDDYITYSQVDRERGKLIAQESYSSGGVLVNKEVTQYRNDVNRFDNNYYRQISHSGQYYSPSCTLTNALTLAAGNQLFSYVYYPVSKTTTTFNTAGANPFTVTENYIYNNWNLLASKSMVNSRGETEQTIYKYPFDIQSSDATYATTSAMVAANNITPVIETSLSNNSVFVKSSRANYYTPSPGIYTVQTLATQQGSAAQELRQQVYAVDLNGMIMEQAKIKGVHEVYLYGYHSQFPVAVITNSTYTAVQAAMSANSITQAQLDNAATMTDAQFRTKLNLLRTGLPNAMVKTYTYAPLSGVTSETDVKGMTTYYEYDSFGRLRVVRDKDQNIVKQMSYHYKQ